MPVQEQYFPGTALLLEDLSPEHGFAVLEPFFKATSGLSLSQVCGLTGLQGSTIQNWVKRGWVSKPQGKRYNETQLARILIINLLRDSMQLERIAQLMAYLNGSVEDRSDDIISDSQLYRALCSLVLQLDPANFSRKGLEELLKQKLKGYEGPTHDAPRRLFAALRVMALAYLSAKLKKESEEQCAKLLDFPSAE